MLKNILLSSLVLTTAAVFGQKAVSSSLESATVFQSGAQLHRTANVQILPADKLLRFVGLPTYIDPNSIQLSASRELELLSVSFGMIEEAELVQRAEVQAIDQKIEALQQQYKMQDAEEAGLFLERQVLEENKKLEKGSSSSLTDLRAMADFARQRRSENAKAWNEVQRKKNELNVQISKLNADRELLLEKLYATAGYVEVQLEGGLNAQVSFGLTYLVNQAGWYSSYDAKVNDLEKPMDLIHKANVYQQSGEDWKDIQLTLATGNPSLSAQLPFMGVWYVNLENVRKMGLISKPLRNANAPTSALAEVVTVDEETSFTSGVRVANRNQNLTQQEYSLKTRQNIPNAPEYSSLILREMQVPAVYEYHAKPRLEKDAFLVAKVHNWASLDLLDGEISLFNNNTFVGRSQLNTSVPQDTLLLSLGRDPSILVSRKRIYTKQEKSFFGGSRIDHYVWEIELRNNKKSPITVVLRDQVPVSQSDEVKVEVKSVGNGQLDEKTGIILWRWTLNAGEQRNTQVSYEVRYPKELNVMYY